MTIIFLQRPSLQNPSVRKILLDTKVLSFDVFMLCTTVLSGPTVDISCLLSPSDVDDHFKNTKQVFEELCIPQHTEEDCRIVQHVCCLISTRAAYLASAGEWIITAVV